MLHAGLWQARQRVGVRLRRSAGRCGCAAFGPEGALRALSSASPPGYATPRWVRALGWEPEALQPGPRFNRWAMLPAATVNHLCLGSIYAWSVFNAPLMRLGGVVAPAASDWTLGAITPTFSLVMGGFATGAVLGRYLEALGPRAACVIGAGCLGSGFSLASAAAASQQLELLYLGGLVWGCANGFAYVPPMAAAVRFFPDRKGFAGGVVLLGFGGGAILATPLFLKLVHYFRVLPDFLGSPDAVRLVNNGGRLFCEGREVVVATAGDLVASGWADTAAQAGVYAVGTGSTGLPEAFLALGLGYGALMASTAFAFRLPREERAALASISISSISSTSTTTTTTKSPSDEAATKPASGAPAFVPPNVSTRDAFFSPQFWLLYAGFGSAALGAYGFLSSGKLIMAEAFSSNVPDIVTAGFTSSFVAGMSVANLSGRLVFPTVSDYLAKWSGPQADPFLARKRVQTFMWTLSPLCHLGVVWSVHQCCAQPGPLPLAVFIASTFGILSVFGGSTAQRPAFTGDLFGLNSMGVVVARQLSVVLPSAYCGPKIVAHFRSEATEEAVRDLAAKVDDRAFELAFGGGKDHLVELLEHKTVSIHRLLELLPAGTQDPTPFLYDKAMYILAGCNALALLTNLALYPVVRSNNNKSELTKTA